MYDAVADPYCYLGTSVLRNIPGLTSQDDWAGRFRTVRISKAGSTFCYPEHIDAELRRIFDDLKAARFHRGLSVANFARNAAHVFAELNAVHPFRDGNGRTQLVFLTMLSAQAGHPFDLDKLDPTSFLQAAIDSFRGEEQSLAKQIAGLVR